MARDIATVVAWALAAYAASGLVFAVAFVARGVDRVDPVAAASGWGFRLVVFPGVVAAWPVLARRWAHGAPPPAERTAHTIAARSRVPGGPPETPA